MSDATNQLIERLACDLEPVRRVPPLRAPILVVALLVLVSGALALILAGFRTDLPQLVRRSPSYDALLVALALVGGAGVVAALAAGIPGRERLAHGSLAVAGAALLTALGVSAAALWWTTSPLPAEAGLGYDAACLAHSCGVALVPAFALVALMARGAPFRPVALVALAASASVGAGALFIHLSCGCDGLRHVLVSHAGAPLLGGLLLALPLYAAFLRLRRGS